MALSRHLVNLSNKKRIEISDHRNFTDPSVKSC